MKRWRGNSAEVLSSGVCSPEEKSWSQTRGQDGGRTPKGALWYLKDGVMTVGRCLCIKGKQSEAALNMSAPPLVTSDRNVHWSGAGNHRPADLQTRCCSVWEVVFTLRFVYLNRFTFIWQNVLKVYFLLKSKLWGFAHNDFAILRFFSPITLNKNFWCEVLWN